MTEIKTLTVNNYELYRGTINKCAEYIYYRCEKETNYYDILDNLSRNNTFIVDKKGKATRIYKTEL